MDGRHDLGVFSAMENSGHPNSQQLRSYGDLCRPPGTPADPTSTLSAAYHSRYLASLPLSSGNPNVSYSNSFPTNSGATFPFLSSMYPGSTLSSVSPTTSFRTPSAPGIGGMRQFWPPTPPPDGYGRYGMNTSLFPLFGSVSPSPDNGTYMTQGLVSRLNTSGHLPHLIDNHKDQGFFSPGFTLASPMTPSSHVTPTTPFSQIIPSLEKHPSYGHMTLGTKELEEVHEANELSSPKVHIDPYKPDRYTSNVRSKSEKMYDKMDYRKSSPSYASKEKQEDVKPLRKVDAKLHIQSPNKISPCEIDVNCAPSIKPDILSPPLDSPRSEVPSSPKPVVKKQAFSPLRVSSPPVPPSSTFSGKLENQCSTCAAGVKGVGIATKLRASSKKSVPASTSMSLRPSETDSDTCPMTVHAHSDSSTVSTWTTIAASSTPQTVPLDISVSTKVSDTKENVCSATKCPSGKPQSPECTFNRVFQEIPSVVQQKSDANVSVSRPNNTVSCGKHVTVTEAVIPTAPKQIAQVELVTHPFNTPSSNTSDNHNQLFNISPAEIPCEPANSKSPNIVHKIKSENIDSVACNEGTDKVTYSVCPTMSSCCKHMYSKSSNSLCKVKDMIKAIEPQKLAIKPSQNVAPKKIEESENCEVANEDTTPAAAAAVTSCHLVLPKAPITTSAELCDSPMKVGSFKAETPMMKAESSPDAFDCKLSQTSVQWTKATVLPYNWQKSSNSNNEDHQAMNLTVSKKSPEVQEPPVVPTSGSPDNTVNAISSGETIKITMENVSLSNTGVIGVCHPNSTKISIASSVNRFSSVATTSQPEVTTEVHLTSKSSLQTLRHNPTPPNNIKGSIVNTSFHARSLKAERLNTKRGKIVDMEKVLPSTRGTLATLAPKLTKKVGFLKDGKASHTLSTSSSVSSTSIVFPASVNPCIPVGIAIAQQRQDTSNTTAVGKTQTSVPSTVSAIVSSTTHSTEIASHEIVRDQKPQDIIPATSTSSSESANFLVTPGSTILSRQWESEAVTRATLPSPWVAHGSIVAPALWIGQGTYAAATAPTSATVPQTLNSVEPSPISLPPGGYQLARDSITGHLFLIPAANIVDRTSLWPSYNTSTGSTLPIQQLVTQQHHTQFEQVLPQPAESEPDCLSLSVQQTHVGEAAKELNVVDSCCLSSGDNSLNNAVTYKPLEHNGKTEGKRDASNSVPSVPLASGQTFTFTTFPTNCDPAGFSYVLQSSTVMHLAHTQTTSSIQTESGKRSQGTSPLHCASPSPPPNNGTVSSPDENAEEESDNDVESVACSEMTHVKMSHQGQSVTTAIQVDMDSQTNSEEDDDESDLRSDITESKVVEMSDSANQTENCVTDSGKFDSENEVIDGAAEAMEDGSNSSQSVSAEISSVPEPSTQQQEEANFIAPLASEPVLEILPTETELAPSLPVESQPVMDFIDHHGLNLLVDSIEEFASREKNTIQKMPEQPISDCKDENISSIHIDKDNHQTTTTADDSSCVINQSYRTLDTSCTDGLGLLCALAEQRFLEESLNTDNQKAQYCNEVSNETSASDDHLLSVNAGDEKVSLDSSNPVNCADTNDNLYETFQDPFDISSTSNLRACELEMRKRLADLQRKYKEKELELARLLPSLNAAAANEAVNQNHDLKKTVSHTKRKSKLFTRPKLKCKSLMSNRSCFSNQSFNKSTQKLFSKQSALFKKSLLQKKRLKKLNRPLTHSKHLVLLRKSSVTNQESLDESPVKKHEVKQFSNCNDECKSSTSVKTRICKSSKLFSSKKKLQSNTKNFSIHNKEKSKTTTSLRIHTGKSVKKESFKGESILFKKIKSEIPFASNENSITVSNHSKESKLSKHIPDGTDNKNSGDSKVPFFDEQAWFIRRSERIFLNDARTPAPQTPSRNNSGNTPKKSMTLTSNSTPIKCEYATKEKKENPSKLHQKTGDASKSVNSVSKTEKEKTEKEKEDISKKIKHKIPTKPKSKPSTVISLCKKRHNSCESSSYSRSSASSSSDSESSGESSSQSDNVPLSLLLDQTSSKEKSKRLSVDSDSSDSSSALSEDIPLSILLGQNNLKTELKSCILTPSELQDKARVLILDEGLFYAGHITAIQAPDVYGIILDGERAHRPHIFSREEILNAAVLEIKPTSTTQLPEGCRICAYWSQQYRCLYPGTVSKASSPASDSSLLYVEFDDGDSGRIPLEDIRMLPPDFPIVSMEPNPLLILGKRRARSDKENSSEQKSPGNGVTHKVDKNDAKTTPKIKKRRLDSADERLSQDKKSFKKEIHCISSTSLKSVSNSENSSFERTSKVLKTKCLKTDSLQSSKNGLKERKLEENIKTKEAKLCSLSDSSGTDNASLSTTLKPKKHKKHKDDHKHHHHHHHHHHRHHHKKHKTQKENHLAKQQNLSADNTVISMRTMASDSAGDSSTYSECHAASLCTEKKSELTVKIKTSPPHTTHDHCISKKVKASGIKSESQSDGYHSADALETKSDTKLKKKSRGKKTTEEIKPAKRKDRVPSVEKSKIAAFLPVRQLWRWSGKSYRRPGTKGKAKKEFYRAIQRGKEMLRVGDCAVFLSTGRPHLPYIGRIETMWESWGGKMDVKVKWFYHPEETKSSKKLTQLKPGALFQSPHFDENDVQTISHKCEVLSWEEYQKEKGQVTSASTPYSSMFDNNDKYYLAGTYDPITGSLTMEPGIPKLSALGTSEG